MDEVVVFCVVGALASPVGGRVCEALSIVCIIVVIVVVFWCLSKLPQSGVLGW